MRDTKVLDCTLRDGGYYNNWDFAEEVLHDYLTAVTRAKIDLIELGLRSFPSETFKGAHAFTSEPFINDLDLPLGPMYGVMIDAKTIISHELEHTQALALLFKSKVDSKLDFVRVAAHYHELHDAIDICKHLKKLGYFVGLNLMQSVGKPTDIIENASKLADESKSIDVLYFADSLGNMEHTEAERIITAIKEYWPGEIGLHAHDNTSRALSNTLYAQSLGVSYLDATITGMGRGAGNTKSEFLLLELERQQNSKYNSSALHEVVLKHFEPMQRECGWGTNLLYYIGATKNVHPTYIQQLYSDKRFDTPERAAAIGYLGSIESSSYDGENIEKALNISQSKFTGIDLTGDDITEIFSGRQVLIIGPGQSTTRYKKAITQYIQEKDPIVISININNSIPEKLINFYTATHNIKFLTDKEKYSAIANKLIAPKSRFSENDISPRINYELSITNSWTASRTNCKTPFELTIAYTLSVCAAGNAKNIDLVGFDGYAHLDERNIESQQTFDHFKSILNIRCLTPTSYNIQTGTIYAI